MSDDWRRQLDWLQSHFGSLQELADALSVSARSIQRWRNEKPPSETRKNAISVQYEIELKHFSKRARDEPSLEVADPFYACWTDVIDRCLIPLPNRIVELVSWLNPPLEPIPCVGRYATTAGWIIERARGQRANIAAFKQYRRSFRAAQRRPGAKEQEEIADLAVYLTDCWELEIREDAEYGCHAWITKPNEEVVEAKRLLVFGYDETLRFYTPSERRRLLRHTSRKYRSELSRYAEL